MLDYLFCLNDHDDDDDDDLIIEIYQNELGKSPLNLNATLITTS